jgi:hypothetical protein
MTKTTTEADPPALWKDDKVWDNSNYNSKSNGNGKQQRQRQKQVLRLRRRMTRFVVSYLS